MTFPTKDYRQIRADILRDIANQNPDAYTGDDSDFAVRASAVGASVEGLYQHQQWIARQLFASTADSDILETRHCNPRGITRKAAAFATGTIRFSGTSGSAVPIGTESKTLSGVAFVTTAAGAVGVGGTVDIAAQASVAGLSGNQAAAVALTLTAAPAGVLSQDAIVSMTGGTDIETDAALLARYLFDLRLPPSGGAKHDYFKWAMEVAGVTDAYIYPQRRNTRSVDVVLETAGGLPSAQLIADVTAYINDATRRPPCSDVLVMAPQLVVVNITGALVLSGITLAAATAQITTLLGTFFSKLELGNAVRKIKLEALITSIPGVLDVTLSAPAANVQPLVDATHSELAVIGTVTLT
jgi:uncharacterized phage protein gp47/JayE